MPAAFTDPTALKLAGDGNTDDGPALQHLFDQAGTIRIPPDTYRVGQTLRLRSRTRLLAHPQATFVYADGAGQDHTSYLLTNADPDGGDHDIEIRGGTWDGNNPGNRRNLSNLLDTGNYSGVMIHFRNIKNLTFGDALLTDAESYFFRGVELDRFTIEDLKFHASHPRPNNDGVHLTGGCHHGIIRRLTGLGPLAPNDDMVALNADDALQRTECQGGTNGPITDITVSQLRADQCHSFVRALSVQSPLERIDLDDIEGGCTSSVLNMDGARGCRVQVFDDTDPRFANGVGNCRDIRLSRVRAWAARVGGNHPLLNLAQHADGLEVRDFTRALERDGAPDAPTLAVAHAPGHRLTINDQPTQTLAHDDRLESNNPVLHRVRLDGPSSTD
ncbi:MAG: endopolygalacturonase [Planctomycetota bacterium]